jgi:hypothetical protein
VFKDMAQIAAVDPVIARRAPHEMLGLVLGRLTDQPADVGSAMMCYLADGTGRGVHGRQQILCVDRVSFDVLGGDD